MQRHERALHGATDADGRRILTVLIADGLPDFADRFAGGAIENEAKGAILIMAHQKHDGAEEVGVRQVGRGDQKVAR